MRRNYKTSSNPGMWLVVGVVLLCSLTFTVFLTMKVL